ncbi:MAG TPA: hypothetical protein VIG64_05360 [Actinomycetota bacterium]
MEVVAQVGDDVNYRVTVSNPGEVPLEGVFVVDLLPSEVTFVSADLLAQVEATLYNRIGTKESITWNVGELAPGQSLTLGWTGTASAAGDMTALNAVRAVARGVRRVRQENSTFLATTATLGGPNEKPRPTKTTVVTYEEMPSGEVLGAPGEPDSELPATGFDGRLALAVGALLAALGAMLWWMAAPGPRRRRRVALALGALALLTACTSGRDLRRAEPLGTGSPEVKGRQIGPDGTVTDPAPDDDQSAAEDRGDDPGDDGGPRSSTDPADAEPTPPSVAVPAPSAPPADALTRLVRHTRVVSIEPELDEPVRLGSASGDNSVGYGWSGNAVTSLTSSALRGPSPEVRMETTVGGSDGVITATVTLTNQSERTPVIVHGNVLHRIGGDGVAATLSSTPLDLLLQPGGTSATSFTYDLPPGTYSAGAAFRSN